MLLVVAGNETTRNSISGGVLALSQFPEQRQKLLDHPSLIPLAVNEIMRWVTPVVYMRRTALADAGHLHAAANSCLIWRELNRSLNNSHSTSSLRPIAAA